jgi:site-specific DNA-methyltransferase (adenine-specific)
MKTVKKKIKDLHFDPSNARKHDDKNLSSIIASLKRFGQQKPIVIDKDSIVRAGNGTLAAAIKLGWDSIDTVTSSLDASELTAYAIADNRTAELAEWDIDVLEQSLKSLDKELADIAYDDYEYKEEPTEVEGNIEDDEVPEVDDNPYGVKRGDVWLLGAYYECESCKKKYSYEEGKEMKECPCG